MTQPRSYSGCSIESSDPLSMLRKQIGVYCEYQKKSMNGVGEIQFYVTLKQPSHIVTSVPIEE
jgi:hypothetical protein